MAKKPLGQLFAAMKDGQGKNGTAASIGSKKGGKKSPKKGC